MGRFRGRAISLLIALATVAPSYTSAWADIVDIAKDFYDGLSKVAELAQKAQQAQSDLQYIEKERKQPPRAWPWQAAVKSFEEAANKIENSRFDISFKPSDFPLPSGDWT